MPHQSDLQLCCKYICKCTFLSYICHCRWSPPDSVLFATLHGTYLYMWYFALHMTYRQKILIIYFCGSIQNHLRKSPDAFLELIFIHPELLPSYSCKHLMLLFTFMIQLCQIIQCERRPGDRGRQWNCIKVWTTAITGSITKTNTKLCCWKWRQSTMRKC